MPIKTREKILLILGISLLEFTISYLVLGVHFEWVDDIFVTLQLKGEVINVQRGYFNLRINNYVAYLHCWLYNNIDGINWYGLSLSLYSFFCLININLILLYLINKCGKYARLLFILMSLFFFSAYIVENIYLLNFTRLAVLLTFTSAICFVIIFKEYRSSKHGRFALSIFCLLFFLGWNCRITIILVFLPALLIFLLLYFNGKKKFIAVGGLCAYTGLYICLSLLFLNQVDRKEFNTLNQDAKYIHNILDAFNGKHISEFDNPRDSIKTLALNRWYFADHDSLFSKDYIQRVGSNTPFNTSVLKKWKSNLNEEIDKAKNNYTSDYLPSMNWFNKSFAMIFLISLLLYFFIVRKDFYKGVLFILSTFTLIIAVAIFLKMEDRALAPLLIFTFLAAWILAKENEIIISQKMISVLIVCFFIISLFRVPGYYQISQQRSKDLKIKEKIRSNINKFYPNRTVFFDIYSYTVLEMHPLWDVNFPDNWTSGPEMYNMYNEKHLKNLDNIVGCWDWPCFFKETSKSPDDFMFFYSHDRITLAEDYNKIIYNYDLKFKKESDFRLVNSLHYSLLWYETRLGYYTIDTSQNLTIKPMLNDSTQFETGIK